MRRQILSIIFCWLAGLGMCFAEPVSAQLSELLNAVNTMRADFVQTTYDEHAKQLQQSYGQMALQRPGKFRWEVKKPIPQLIIANESRLWIYDPDLEQVTIRTLKSAAGDTPALLLSHVNGVLNEAYTVKSIQKSVSGWNWYQLIPKSADNMFASIQMGFMNKEIREMILQDHLGHSTRIQFQRIKTNIPLAASLFVYKAGKHVDVIDETK